MRNAEVKRNFLELIAVFLDLLEFKFNRRGNSHKTVF